MSDALAWSNWIGVLGALVGAILGALALTQPKAALAGLGLAATGGSGLSTARAFGGLLLASHAMTATVLLQEPRIGACFAGALAAGWFGAAFGRLVSRIRDPSISAYPWLFIDVALSVALAAPLGVYLRLMRIHAGL